MPVTAGDKQASPPSLQQIKARRLASSSKQHIVQQGSPACLSTSRGSAPLSFAAHAALLALRQNSGRKVRLLSDLGIVPVGADRGCFIDHIVFPALLNAFLIGVFQRRAVQAWISGPDCTLVPEGKIPSRPPEISVEGGGMVF